MSQSITVIRVVYTLIAVITSEFPGGTNTCCCFIQKKYEREIHTHQNVKMQFANLLPRFKSINTHKIDRFLAQEISHFEPHFVSYVTSENHS
jgi:hypothetical protein